MFTARAAQVGRRPLPYVDSEWAVQRDLGRPCFIPGSDTTYKEGRSQEYE
jgi:hypothetical protein